jgi:bifunctional non-homologous end joining protein LigD
MGGIPRLIKPMLASLAPGLPRDEGRYGWEFKWDGVRAIAYVSSGRLRLLSRNGHDMTPSYPELDVLAGQVSVPVILDGEIIAIRGGRPDFGLLQSRLHVRRPPSALISAAPVHLYLFDVLYADGEMLLGLPYTARRQRLEALGLGTGPVRTTPWYRGGAADVLAASRANGLEGVVGKPLASAYHPGQRGGWIKVKNIRHAEVIIGGWKPGQGRRADTIGSLLLGVLDGGQLRYAGHVGTGFTQAMLIDLARRLRALRRATSPFASPVPAGHARGAQWAQPRLVGEVAFTEWTAGLLLRHPSWRGLRTDKDPGDLSPDS